MKLNELFDIEYGNSLELCRLIRFESPDAINFVSRSGNNNGITATVKKVDGEKIYPTGTITIALGGSVLASFVQPKIFYTGRDVMTCVEKKSMSLIEKLYYCECIKANKFKYNFNRQANRTLKDIELPDKVPDWVYKIDPKKYERKILNLKDNPKKLLSDNTKLFKVTDLFEIVKGKGPSLYEAQENPGDMPFITATGQNNGIACYTSLEAEHKGNCLTCACNGSIGVTFYQSVDFCGTSDINVLIPKFELTEDRALFLIPIFEAHKFKYNYGRKWNLECMKATTIALPSNDKGEVDWEYIDKFMADIKTTL